MATVSVSILRPANRVEILCHTHKRVEKYGFKHALSDNIEQGRISIFLDPQRRAEILWLVGK